MGLEIKRNSLTIGENTGKVYGIVKYPQDLDYNWLSRITNIPGTILTLSTMVAICSVALGKPTINSMAILGDISIGGTLIKVEELGSHCRYA